MPEQLTALLDRYGYAAVFVGVFLENAGVPVPGETMLIAAAIYARSGGLHLGWIIIASVCGAILGDNAGYFIGRRGGRRLLERHGRVIGLTPDRLRRIDDF